MGHDARSKKDPGPKHPSARDVVAAREAAGLTQTAAAEKIYSTLRTWQDWEAPGSNRTMHRGLYKLFLMETGQVDRLTKWLAGK